MKFASCFHPYYKDWQDEYVKWRTAWESGRYFINRYLEKFSSREDQTEFDLRKKLTYCPGFAKEIINEVKNSIYQRMDEISRISTDTSYKTSIEGRDGGVDTYGSDMNKFIGQKVLPEMMVMGKVGVWVDMPELQAGATLADYNIAPHPYLYYFTCEDMVNWLTVVEDNEIYYTAVILRERRIVYDPLNGMPIGNVEVYRYARLIEDAGRTKVLVQIWEPDERNKDSDKLISEQILDIPMIPLVVFDLGDSLMKALADYQIGLMNLASADLNYALQANFTFYTESYDPRAEPLYMKKGPVSQSVDSAAPLAQVANEQANTTDDPAEMRVGITRGRRYPTGGTPPQFINPSSEPLKASMLKQEQMQMEMRRLLNLTLSNVAPSRASAEAKIVDNQGLESGLSAIGLELQGGERQIAKIWNLYTATKADTNIIYPTSYSLKSDQQRIDETNKLKELQSAVPSKTFQKVVAKKVVCTLFEGELTHEVIDIINNEIDQANYVTSDPKTIQIAVELGLVQAKTASDALGFDGEEEVPIAQKEHADRIATIAQAQSANAGGVTDTNPVPGKTNVNKGKGQE